jgi:hypothetical protein
MKPILHIIDLKISDKFYIECFRGNILFKDYNLYVVNYSKNQLINSIKESKKNNCTTICYFIVKLKTKKNEHN